MQTDFSVLIVEDDDDARRNMEDILSLDGYRTRCESHCLPAINAIESDSFDAVIIDWRLPDGDGGELIPLIVKHQPNAPVVVVTGIREFDTAVTALRRGAYDFLLKPVNPDALRSALRRLVERKKHLMEIELAQKRLVSAERLAAIGEMVAGLAHESRNAFQRSHACLAELSLDVADMPESLKLVQKVQKALDDLNCLLDQVREYSAPIILERRRTNLKSLVRETWDEVLEAKQNFVPPEFIMECGAGFPEQCMVDPDRLKQVIRNLLENAIFASRSGGKITVILGRPHDRDDWLRIEVADDGDGVDEKHRESIFAPFFTTKTKGTGLGLAISRRIIQAHDGQLWVTDSRLGGAAFMIELPFREK